jgi:hypothetical protein
LLADHRIEDVRIGTEKLEIQRRRTHDGDVAPEGIVQGAVEVVIGTVRVGEAVQGERPGVLVPVGVDPQEVVTNGPGQPQIVLAERPADAERVGCLGGCEARDERNREGQGRGPWGVCKASHRNAPFMRSAIGCNHGRGAQTERRGDARPAGACFAVRTPPAAFRSRCRTTCRA